MQNVTFDNPLLVLITEFTKRLIPARHARLSFSGLVNENEILGNSPKRDSIEHELTEIWSLWSEFAVERLKGRLRLKRPKGCSTFHNRKCYRLPYFSTPLSRNHSYFNLNKDKS